jgi:hypothetical protein
MAKGRPRKRKPKPGERVPLGLRVTPHLKDALDRAAAESGRSQSQEAEFRIERSFAEQRSLLEALELTYGRELAGILLMLGESMKLSGTHAGFIATDTLEGSQKWWDNAYSFAQASEAAAAVLDAIKPEGDPTPPQESSFIVGEPLGFQGLYSNLGRGFANMIIEEAGSGYTRTSGTSERARLLRRMLGPLSDRLRKFCSEEWLNAETHIGDD